MLPLHRKGTRTAPAVILDLDQRIFQFTGVSTPEDVKEFYDPVLEWFSNAVPRIPNGSTISFSLDYFNSSSLKALYLIFQELKKGVDAGKQLNIQWFIGDQDDFMLDAGETLSHMTGVPVKIVTGTLG